MVPHSDAKDSKTFPVLDIDFATDGPYKDHTPNMVFPYFTIIEVICYMGWIKVYLP